MVLSSSGFGVFHLAPDDNRAHPALSARELP